MVAVLLIAFFALLIFGTPIITALMGSSLLSFAMYSTKDLKAVAQAMFASNGSFSLLAIPLFVLAGALMSSGGISKRLIKFFDKLVGWMPGGMAIVAVLACAFFGALSGSAPATVAAIGGIMIPAMIEKDYDTPWTTCLLASSGSLGAIIPPSIPMVLYGVLAKTSVSALFCGGIIPGLLIALGYCLYARGFSKKFKMITSPKPTGKELWKALAKKLLSSKLCRGRPVMTMVMLFLATYVAAAFIGGPPVYILFFGLVESIRDVCGYDKDDPFVKWTLLGVYIAATGIFFFAFKTPQVMTIALINSAMEPFGRTFNEGTWMLCMFSITMIYLIVYTILMKTVYRVNMEPLKSLDFNEIEAMRNTPDHFNRDQIISLAMIIIPVIYILIGTVYPKEAPGRYFFTFMGNSWIWVLMCAIGALIRRKDSKQSIVPINKCLSEASMWTMISLVGALVMLGKVTSDANLGIRQWLVEVLSPLFGGANIWVLMAIVILFSTLVTQVANGLVLTMAVCPVVTPLLYC